MSHGLVETSSTPFPPSAGVLVIDDDPSVQRALKRLFESVGCPVHVAGNGRDGLLMLEQTRPGTVILDLRLPDISGQDVCREIKQRSPVLPVLILSAVTDELDKILLLELGADDYVTKPFSPRELLARVRAAWRKNMRTMNSESFAFGDLTVDFAKMEVSRNGTAVPLTHQEFKLLRFFALNRDRVISREELLAEVWSYEGSLFTRTVDSHVMKLRHKLEADPANPVHIKTVHGAGYKFVV